MHLWNALAYVERNPVRAGLSERAEEFEWSSAAAHLKGKDPSRMLDLDFWREAGGGGFWTELLRVHGFMGSWDVLICTLQ